MDEFVKAHNRIIFETTMESLKKHGFGAQFFSTREEAANFIMNQAADCKSVGIAGTHTVRALGVVPMLEKAGKTMFDHWKLKIGTPEELQCRKDQMSADLFLASVNALTMTGEIVNREGCGNRTNSMTFGPGKVILVAGRNKIVPDLDSAIARIRRNRSPHQSNEFEQKDSVCKSGSLYGL